MTPTPLRFVVVVVVVVALASTLATAATTADDEASVLRAVYTAAGGAHWRCYDDTQISTARPRCVHWQGESVATAARVLPCTPARVWQDSNWLTQMCRHGEHVRELYLMANRLRGTVTARLGELTLLTDLFLSQNTLSGTVPSELFRSPLSTLMLEHNELSGEIPTQIGDAVALTMVALHDNKLSGRVPTELGRLTLLNTLRLQDNSLSGTVPAVLDELPELALCDFRDNPLLTCAPTPLLGKCAFDTDIAACDGGGGSGGDGALGELAALDPEVIGQTVLPRTLTLPLVTPPSGFQLPPTPPLFVDISRLTGDDSIGVVEVPVAALLANAVPGERIELHLGVGRPRDVIEMALAAMRQVGSGSSTGDSNRTLLSPPINITAASIAGGGSGGSGGGGLPSGDDLRSLLGKRTEVGDGSGGAIGTTAVQDGGDGVASDTAPLTHQLADNTEAEVCLLRTSTALDECGKSREIECLAYWHEVQRRWVCTSAVTTHAERANTFCGTSTHFTTFSLLGKPFRASADAYDNRKHCDGDAASASASNSVDGGDGGSGSGSGMSSADADDYDHASDYLIPMIATVVVCVVVIIVATCALYVLVCKEDSWSRNAAMRSRAAAAGTGAPPPPPSSSRRSTSASPAARGRDSSWSRYDSEMGVSPPPRSDSNSGVLVRESTMYDSKIVMGTGVPPVLQE